MKDAIGSILRKSKVDEADIPTTDKIDIGDYVDSRGSKINYPTEPVF